MEYGFNAAAVENSSSGTVVKIDNFYGLPPLLFNMMSFQVIYLSKYSARTMKES
jgi:hypothetical protein